MGMMSRNIITSKFAQLPQSFPDPALELTLRAQKHIAKSNKKDHTENLILLEGKDMTGSIIIFKSQNAKPSINICITKSF